jgi:GTP cyclohydrolase II
VSKNIITFVETSELPTDIANFKVHAFTEKENNKDHLVIAFGDLSSDQPVLARIHSQCITGESFFSMRCDCRFQLTESLRLIANKGCGVVFYLQQEGRGIGLSNKIRAYKLQDQGLDTVEANHQLGFGEDERSYEIVSAMAKHLNVKIIDLMTNNPKKIEAVIKSGLIVNKRIPIKIDSNDHNRDYLNTKAKKLGHLM